MKKIISFCFFLWLSGQAFAQVGISSGIQFFNATEWEKTFQETYNNSQMSIFDPAVYIGLDYWFRLKNRRIEFTPEVAYARYRVESTLIPHTTDSELRDDYEITYWSLFLNTNFYVFDFEGDCDCPTFSKDGDMFKKGLFLRVAPGLNYVSQVNDRRVFAFGNESDSDPAETFNELAFSIRAGVGLDIGVSDFITLTPIVQANYNLPLAWNKVGIGEPNETVQSIEDSVLHLFAGLRLGFRFDELNKYGRR